MLLALQNLQSVIPTLDVALKSSMLDITMGIRCNESEYDKYEDNYEYYKATVTM